MATEAGNWRTKGEWVVFDGRSLASRVSNGHTGYPGHNESTGGGFGESDSSLWDEYKDMMNDALGG